MPCDLWAVLVDRDCDSSFADAEVDYVAFSEDDWPYPDNVGPAF